MSAKTPQKPDRKTLKIAFVFFRLARRIVPWDGNGTELKDWVVLSGFDRLLDAEIGALVDFERLERLERFEDLEFSAVGLFLP